MDGCGHYGCDDLPSVAAVWVCNITHNAHPLCPALSPSLTIIHTETHIDYSYLKAVLFTHNYS